MSIKFRKEQPEENNEQGIGIPLGMPKQLPLQKDILLYPRVSTPGQLKNVSAELQAQEDGELMRMAKAIRRVYIYFAHQLETLAHECRQYWLDARW